MNKFLNFTLLFALFLLVSCNNKTQTQETETPTEMTAAERNAILAQEKADRTTAALARAEAEKHDGPRLDVSEKGKMKADETAPPSSRLRGQFAKNAAKAESEKAQQPTSPSTPSKPSTTTAPAKNVQPTTTPIKSPRQPIEKPAEPMEQTEEMTTEPVRELEPSHEIWNGLLSRYVSSTGKVNYDGLKSNEATLDKYLAILSENHPNSDWDRNEAKAFWLNAYNAYTVKLILKNYPVKSITDLHDGKPWDVKWIKIGDKTYSLNNIENDIIRPTYKDGRIHFAVNCAAKSCPPLYNKAFTGDGLSGTLTALAKKFINNSQYNTINADAVEVSKIFEWYAEDFGDLTAYLNKYSNTKINDGATISYKEYDWALNN